MSAALPLWSKMIQDFASIVFRLRDLGLWSEDLIGVSPSSATRRVDNIQGPDTRENKRFLNHNGSEADMEELAKINPSSNGTDLHG